MSHVRIRAVAMVAATAAVFSDIESHERAWRINLLLRIQNELEARMVERRGIRIMLVDFVPMAVRYQRILFWTVMILTIVCFLPMAYFVIAPIFGVNAGNTASGV